LPSIAYIFFRRKRFAFERGEFGCHDGSSGGQLCNQFHHRPSLNRDIVLLLLEATQAEYSRKSALYQ